MLNKKSDNNYKFVPQRTLLLLQVAFAIAFVVFGIVIALIPISNSTVKISISSVCGGIVLLLVIWMLISLLDDNSIVKVDCTGISQKQKGKVCFICWESVKTIRKEISKKWGIKEIVIVDNNDNHIEFESSSHIDSKVFSFYPLPIENEMVGYSSMPTELDADALKAIRMLKRPALVGVLFFITMICTLLVSLLLLSIGKQYAPFSAIVFVVGLILIGLSFLTGWTGIITMSNETISYKVWCKRVEVKWSSISQVKSERGRIYRTKYIRIYTNDGKVITIEDYPNRRDRIVRKCKDEIIKGNYIDIKMDN